MWKLLTSLGVIFDSKWSHSLHIMLMKGSLVINFVGKYHAYVFDAETKINVYKKEGRRMAHVVDH